MAYTPLLIISILRTGLSLVVRLLEFEVKNL